MTIRFYEFQAIDSYVPLFPRVYTDMNDFQRRNRESRVWTFEKLFEVRIQDYINRNQKLSDPESLFPDDKNVI